MPRTNAGAAHPDDANVDTKQLQPTEVWHPIHLGLLPKLCSASTHASPHCLSSSGSTVPELLLSFNFLYCNCAGYCCFLLSISIQVRPHGVQSGSTSTVRWTAPSHTYMPTQQHVLRTRTGVPRLVHSKGPTQPFMEKYRTGIQKPRPILRGQKLGPNF